MIIPCLQSCPLCPSIDVYERYTYVAVARSRSPQVLKLVRNAKIKGQRTVVEPLGQEK